MNGSITDLNNKTAAVVTLTNMPAGSYIVSGTLTVAGNAPAGTQGVTCHFGPVNEPPPAASAGAGTNFAVSVNMALTTSYTLATTGSIPMTCTGANTGNGTFYLDASAATMTAIKVGTLHVG